MKIVVIVLVAFSAVQGFKPKCRSSFETMLSPDCGSLYQCVWGKPVSTPSCPSGQLFSRTRKVCVRKNSQHDDCTGTFTVQADVDVDDVCEENLCQNGGSCTDVGDKIAVCSCPPNYTGKYCETVVQSFTMPQLCAVNPNIKMPHPTECQLYYDCSHTYDTVPRFFEQHMKECPYPQQFSDITLTCESFEDVTCGTRTDYKSACDYRSYKCPVAHCYPCDLTLPSCEGFSDGMHAHATKVGSPEFMICLSERIVQTGTCPVDKDTLQQTFVKDGQCSLPQRYTKPFDFP
ncbi:uncharacterized protein [Argopecten irradians]|uniref:uncharacterized protein n=1 Tax=Argopecten irradians TaxID=31199 RepID=UPI00371FD1ED